MASRAIAKERNKAIAEVIEAKPESERNDELFGEIGEAFNLSRPMVRKIAVDAGLYQPRRAKEIRAYWQKVGRKIEKAKNPKEVAEIVDEAVKDSGESEAFARRKLRELNFPVDRPRPSTLENAMVVVAHYREHKNVKEAGEAAGISRQAASTIVQVAKKHKVL